MNVLFILVPVSLFLAGLALGFFLWTLRNEQYDDLEGDAWRILSDDDRDAELGRFVESLLAGKWRWLYWCSFDLTTGQADLRQ
jgi:cbb3-type cytochrome oxidase maturation protein